jgi:4-hydroxy-2-oxoheptanedioate aldolase
MQTPANPFKNALAQRQPQIGLWLGLANAYCAEICAGAGFDWLLVDGEHAPNGLTDILAQLQAIAAYPGAHAIARVPVGDTALIKQYLDIGAQTLLVPMVDTAEQAAAAGARLPLPPRTVYGRHGQCPGARVALAGATRVRARGQRAACACWCRPRPWTAMQNLDAIAATPGVDGVFIGPADLSASLGHVGNPGHPDVQAAIEDAIARILKAGKAPGILTSDEAQARHYLALGAVFVAVGLDTGILVRQTSALAAKFKHGVAAAPATKGAVY